MKIITLLLVVICTLSTAAITGCGGGASSDSLLTTTTVPSVSSTTTLPPVTGTTTTTSMAGTTSISVTTSTTSTTATVSTTTLPPPAAEAPFSMVVFPDSQNEVDNGADKVVVWQKQNQWVVNNKTAQNIVAVLGVGDVVNDPSDVTYTTATVKGYDLIANAGIPYLSVVGNHDFPDLDVSKRDSSIYDRYFGPFRFAGSPWYMGGYPAKSNANMAIAFDAGVRRFLVVGLEIFPRFQSVTWAQGIIDANPGREVIVVTHAYLRRDGTRYLVNDAGVDPNTTYSGQGLWESFIRFNSRIFMVIGGHDICTPTEAYLKSTGMAGNVVHQIFTNHQCFPDNGSVLLLRFKPTAGIIELVPYSTSLDANAPESAPYTVPY